MSSPETNNGARESSPLGDVLCAIVRDQTERDRRRLREGPTVVYRAYDAAGRLLYVGSTHNVARRRREHARRAPWYPAAAHWRYDEYPTRAAGLAAEDTAIRAEQPRWNRNAASRAARALAAWQALPPRRRAAIERARALGRARNVAKLITAAAGGSS